MSPDLGAAAPGMLPALGSEGRAQITAWIARRPLFAFDIDGTLAPIVAHPDEASIPDALQAALASLAAVATVAVLTGRGRDDAQRLLRFTPAWVLGNHGIEGLPGWQARSARLAAMVRGWRAAVGSGPRAAALAAAGVMVEDKRYSLSLHDRHAPDLTRAEAAIDAVVAGLDPPPRIIQGKRVVNVLPEEAPTKGDALIDLLHHVGIPCAFYAGDDDTDEHVFDLPRERVLGVRVGLSVASHAALYVDSPDDLLPLVRLLDQGVRNDARAAGPAP